MIAALGSLAQLVEQRTFNPLVAGSNPARPTKNLQQLQYVKSQPSPVGFFFYRMHVLSCRQSTLNLAIMPFTIAAPVHSELIIKKSRFIGCVQPIARASAQQVVNGLRAASGRGARVLGAAGGRAVGGGR